MKPEFLPWVSRICCLAVLVMIAPRLPARDVSTPDADLIATLRALTQQNLDAIAPGRSDVWRNNAHPLLTHVDENGEVRSRDALLAELTPLPNGLVGRIAIERFSVRRVGNVAIATHLSAGCCSRSSRSPLPTTRLPSGFRKPCAVQPMADTG
jgi:hypothetical protein